MLYRPFAAAIVALIAFTQSAAAQCTNQVAAYNPNVRTLGANSTWFIVPVPKTAVQAAIDETNTLNPFLKGLTLLPIPSADTSLFPRGFPADKHPVLVNIALTTDIRMSALQIDGGLMQASLYVPYVAKRGSQAPLNAALTSYIAGEKGPLPNGLVPAVASPLLFGGNPIRLGQFIPEAQPYHSDAGGTLSAGSKWVIIPNSISGPGVTPEAADFVFKTSSQGRYTAKAFKSIINQPMILPTGKCQRNTYYFNNATALPAFRNGQVTFGPGANGNNPISSGLQKASPDGSGVYQDNDGYSACAQNVGNNIEDCEVAARTVDPASLS